MKHQFQHKYPYKEVKDFLNLITQSDSGVITSYHRDTAAKILETIRKNAAELKIKRIIEQSWSDSIEH